MAMTAAAVSLLVPAGLGTAADTATGDGGDGPRVSAPRIEAALLAEMNRVRADRGRRALRPIATLRRPARAQSRYLLGQGILDHAGRDGAPFWTRLIAAGYPSGRTLGENLAMVPGCGPEVAARTVAMWLRSPGHRANLLNPAFRWAGTGAASDAGCTSTVLTADYGS